MRKKIADLPIFWSLFLFVFFYLSTRRNIEWNVCMHHDPLLKKIILLITTLIMFHWYEKISGVIGKFVLRLMCLILMVIIRYVKFAFCRQLQCINVCISKWSYIALWQSTSLWKFRQFKEKIRTLRVFLSKCFIKLNHFGNKLRILKKIKVDLEMGANQRVWMI